MPKRFVSKVCLSVASTLHDEVVSVACSFRQDMRVVKGLWIFVSIHLAANLASGFEPKSLDDLRVPYKALRRNSQNPAEKIPAARISTRSPSIGE